MNNISLSISIWEGSIALLIGLGVSIAFADKRNAPNNANNASYSPGMMGGYGCDPGFQLEGGYFSVWFVIAPLALLGFVYLLTKIDRKILIEHRKLAWRRSLKRPDDVGQGHTTNS
ncbi:hypothetical protein LMG28688_02777 [Paraburkholderia caffeinitolerans]|uniref:Uncharacterized protein n=1 Tax=Paraburkholderia caffeinitolerans TaxID=1723730 RepID=A0A6J5G0Q2_9BURK|nr:MULTISPECIES: hypothetical protein [Paraburkholderia]CAB3788881.1 hypothetical protein LMG28688_02777 [Paraburkholderia caffeinitolerans]